ncbi:MAG TPA: 6,7-dimethyl-8-ribityllumazine synthase [Verrucomicrobiae bacterium]|nr:6,7-dimethyl-8-ribityllumazine synthase [Verrucomicrobiae bacterium]
MLRAKKTERRLSAAGLRFGIATARYNTDLADALLANCIDTLAKAGADTCDIKVLRVPGSFEVTAAAARLAKSGTCDCVIGLGILLEGETRHAHLIGSAVAHGLTNIAIQTGVPTVFGIVAANKMKQARVRCLGKKHNRGREAALTAIEMARLWKNL